jgi:hypothetical protein
MVLLTVRTRIIIRMFVVEFQKESLQQILGVRREVEEITRLLNANVTQQLSSFVDPAEENRPSVPADSVDSIKVLSQWTENGVNRLSLVMHT